MKNLAFLSMILFISVVLFSAFSDPSKKESKQKSLLDKKVDELLSQMTLNEKIGQMTQADIDALKGHYEDIEKYSLGSILCGGNSEIEDISAKGWADFYDMLQTHALNSRLHIPMIYGVDAVHGHNNVTNAVVFPHNVGLGATRNAKLIEKAARVTAEEVAATGMDWAFAPCIAVARNEHWGRTYESFGEDPELAKLLGAAQVKGFQGKKLSDKTSILACAKHFLGDGGTTTGKDQGNTEVDEPTLRKLHLPGYKTAIKAGTKTIMVSYNSWNGIRMHGNKYLLTDVLKGELNFNGILVSDWAAIDQLEGDYKSDIEKSINAGLDMIMIPNPPGKENNYIDFITLLKELVNENKVPISRIDDAVKRILRVKFEMNIFENPLTDRSLMATFGSKEHRQVARECVRQSLVLLKNENKTLPISKNVKNIVLAGKSADDIGNQCGGWTIDWQGKSGNVITGGTTVLQAVKNAVSKNTVVSYSKDGSEVKDADVVLVVVGETPYAEMFGDKPDLNLAKEDVDVIENVRKSGKPFVVVLFSGRPLIIEKQLKDANAFLAAWLPGSEGAGITDVLFGDFNFTGKLGHSWPKTNEQIPINVGDKNYDPLFKYSFGLKY
ncbi:MAG: glycoside hydrolase family 3 C-terminal domain-containing protein [Ignavibacteriaceae bacterium]|nr:glycoside hydrolase family 3 C-terminal domain-containing protein [Ignavibacteriaceae bacterium]